MFAGIVETTGTIAEIAGDRSNKVFWIESALSAELKVDQSVAHDGTCLTVEELRAPAAGSAGMYRVSAIAETLAKTNLGEWATGRGVNLERCVAAGDRIDGHFVQGHVDTTGTVTDLREHDGSREIFVQFPAEFEDLIVAKGSICVNGVSLTVVASRPDEHIFSVHIIPYTIENTNLKALTPGSRVNLEFDVLGKYIQKIMHRRMSGD